MKAKNRYIIRARISEKVFGRFLRYFAADVEAKKIADFTGLNRNTVNRYTRLLRERIAEDCERERQFDGVPAGHNIDCPRSHGGLLWWMELLRKPERPSVGAGI